MTMEYKVTKEDWQHILKVMLHYNRQGGFIHILDGKLTYFDSNPTIDGVGGFYVTKYDVTEFIENYK